MRWKDYLIFCQGTRAPTWSGLVACFQLLFLSLSLLHQNQITPDLLLFLEHYRFIPASDYSLCLEFSASRFLSGCFLFVILNWIILGHGGYSGYCRVYNSIPGLCPSASTTTFQLWKPKLAQKLSLMELHTVKEWFFLTLVFYLRLANTQNYLEEITSYDGPLQNPQK